MNFLALTGCYMVFGGLGAGVFLWGKPEGDNALDLLSRLVRRHLPGGIKRLLGGCCGRRAPALLDGLWNYVFHTSNPLGQIVYICFVYGFFGAASPRLSGRLAGEAFQYLYIGLAPLSTAFFTWRMACRTDPGIVSPINADELCQIYESDGVLFNGARCKTCEVTQPGRSKHCDMVNACVAKYDHYCVWINNCVGVGNHKWFLGCLFWHAVVFLYAAGVGAAVVCGVVEEKSLLEARFVDPDTRETLPATHLLVARYLLDTESTVIFYSLFSLVVGLVLLGYLLWHLNLVRAGTTTHERSRWSKLRRALAQQGGEAGKERAKGLVNVYNKGVFRNFWEVVYNVDVRRLPAQDGRKDQAPKPGRDKKGKPKKS